jgi:hypothetical protein
MAEKACGKIYKILGNHEVANIMRNNKNYEILHDEINDRNGFLISKKND